MNEPLTADQAWSECLKYRSDFENAPWSDVRVKNAAMYMGMHGAAQADEITLYTHYAKLFRLEYIRLTSSRSAGVKADLDGGGMSECLKAMYELSDAAAAQMVREAGLPEKMGKNDAMRIIREYIESSG